MKEMDYVWHLRAKMAERGMFATTDLQPLLAERGVALSREQTYRLVTGQPQRLSMVTLIALCDILECTPNDLIEPIAEPATGTATGTSTHRPDTAAATTRSQSAALIEPSLKATPLGRAGEEAGASGGGPDTAPRLTVVTQLVRPRRPRTTSGTTSTEVPGRSA